MRASTTESWTGRWLLAARSPWTRRSSTVAVLFGVVGLAAVHLSVGAAPEQGSASPVDACDPPTWVAAWSAPPQASSTQQAPLLPAGVEGTGPGVYENQTLRMVLTPAAGGSRMRIRLSNRFGPAAVTFGAVHVGRHAGGGAIVAGTDRTVAFAGSPSVTVPPGRTVASDEIDLPVEPFTDLAVSVHVADATALDVHLFAQQTQFATPRRAGDHTGDGGGGAFTQRLASWLAVSALDVLAPRPIGVVVALGDSITDGVGSTPDANQRWTDQLARRLLAEPGPPSLTVVNAGIGGNKITAGTSDEPRAGMGPDAVTRFDADVVEVTGVTDVVVFIGINDLYRAEQPRSGGRDHRRVPGDHRPRPPRRSPGDRYDDHAGSGWRWSRSASAKRSTSGSARRDPSMPSSISTPSSGTPPVPPPWLRTSQRIRSTSTTPATQPWPARSTSGASTEARCATLPAIEDASATLTADQPGRSA